MNVTRMTVHERVRVAREFGARVRSERLRRGIATQTELAFAARCSKATISAVERSTWGHHLTTEMAQQIADALGGPTEVVEYTLIWGDVEYEFEHSGRPLDPEEIA